MARLKKDEIAELEAREQAHIRLVEAVLEGTITHHYTDRCAGQVRRDGGLWADCRNPMGDDGSLCDGPCEPLWLEVK